MEHAEGGGSCWSVETTDRLGQPSRGSVCCCCWSTALPVLVARLSMFFTVSQNFEKFLFDVYLPHLPHLSSCKLCAVSCVGY